MRASIWIGSTHVEGRHAQKPQRPESKRGPGGRGTREQKSRTGVIGNGKWVEWGGGIIWKMLHRLPREGSIC